MKEIEVKTKRLTLRPMTDAEIEALIARTESEELRVAYGEMLDGCRRDPENRIWYAPWRMALKGGPDCIGDLDFKGPAKAHAVEIGYGILPEYEGNGYTTEAASQRVLEKCGFTPDGTMGLEGPRFVLESPLTNWQPIYMLFGMSIGMSLGSLRGQMALGMAVGLGLGSLVGILLSQSEKQKREALRAERKK